MAFFWWLLPLVAGLPTVCVGPCDTGVVEATTQAVLGTVDESITAVDQSLGTAIGLVEETVEVKPQADEETRTSRTSQVIQQAQQAAAATPWWAALGGSLLAVAALFHAPLAGMFSRIRHEKVLDHPTRRMALDLVQAEPGLTVKQLASRADVSWQTMRGHLRRLESHGLLLAQPAGKTRLYFAQGTEAAHARSRLAVLQAAGRRRIAELLVREPGLDQAGLCQRLGLRNPSASKHLARLQQAGLVEARPDGRRRRYAPTSALTGTLASM